MTQKELLYLEDAIEHEKSIVKILEEGLNKIEDENLITFIQNKIESHNSTKENLINMLEEKTNE